MVLPPRTQAEALRRTVMLESGTGEWIPITVEEADALRSAGWVKPGTTTDELFLDATRSTWEALVTWVRTYREKPAA